MHGVGNLTRAAYATAYGSFLENRKFSRSKAKYEVALRGIHAAYFLIMFYFGLFPVPPEDVNLESAPLSFAADALLQQ